MIAPRRRIGVGAVRLSDRAVENVASAMSADRLTAGRWTREFEDRFARLHGREFACFVNSGTDALRVGLAAMKEAHGWRDGSVVAVPAVTFVATLNVVLQCGLKPYLVDIEMEHFGMNPLLIPGDAVCAIPAHLFGHVSPTMRVLAGLGIPVLADSCETLGMPGCADGDVSAFSTYAAHILSTGVGGLATTNNPQLAGLIRSYANHGRSGIYTGIDDELGRVEVIEARFHFERSGYSSRATELEAAIGCAELDMLNDNLVRRCQNAVALSSGLAGLLTLPSWREWESSWMMYPLLAASRADRDRLVQHLEANGVETRPLLPLTNQPYVRTMFGRDLDRLLPVAHRVNETGFYVGCHQHLTLDDMDYMVDVFKSFYG